MLHMEWHLLLLVLGSAHFNPRKFKGEVCRGGHLAVTYGRGVIVPPDFFIAKPAKQFH